MKSADLASSHVADPRTPEFIQFDAVAELARLALAGPSARALPGGLRRLLARAATERLTLPAAETAFRVAAAVRAADLDFMEAA